jgi:polyisoprenoid-binding protein YceI
MVKLVTLAILVSLIGCSTRLSLAPMGSNLSESAMMPTTATSGRLLLSPQNSRITFIGSTLLSSHEGTFTQFTGRLDRPGSDPKDAQFRVEIEMDSVFTKVPLLTKDLKASDFFDVAKYPESTFVSTRIQSSVASGSNYIITGNFTIHGITRALSFPARFDIDPKSIRLDATLDIRQSDFSMKSARTTTDDVPVTVSCRIVRS